jgi:general stress protein YciG
MTIKKKRGFGAMAPAKQKELARKGGQSAHAQGLAHEFSPEEARVAGQKGGRAVSSNREHMAEIGRRGGHASGKSCAKKDSSPE